MTMTDDKALLEAAARAAGIQIDYTDTNGGGRFNTGFDMLGNAVLDWHNGKTWNPLTDDGDALRLAAKLYLHKAIAEAHRLVDDKTDIYAATRRAIVLAAASLGQERRE